ncbi:MAG: FAD-binding protein [Candidatus Melainabacteria bacterium]|nr:FAD-binding protein [Candidatus Melainabacteria bacterium]
MSTDPSNTKEDLLTSFDGGYKCKVKTRNIISAADLIAFDDLKSKHFISRGAGMSFAPASFAKDTISLLNQGKSAIEFDKENKLVQVEAGISMGELGHFLMQKGFYLKTVPGYPSITVGGCIASDAHGKNQLQDGTFQNLVDSFELYHPAHGLQKVSRASNLKLFDLTCGGFGLTGHLLSCKLRISKLKSQYMNLHTEELTNIYDLPLALERIFKRDCDMLLSWHNFLLNGNKFGHGFIQYGFFAKNLPFKPDTDTSLIAKPDPGLFADSRGEGWPPLFGFPATSLMNSLYTYLQKMSCVSPKAIPLSSCSFPSLKLRDLYFSAFGSTGFLEHQAVVPVFDFADYIDRIKWWLQANDLPITIASSKYFGGSGKYLQFKQAGICFAMDFPRCQKAYEFLEYLDQVCIELGCLPNIIKDSRIGAFCVSKTYREYEKFRKDLRDYDPARLCRSELSCRLKL